MMYHFMGNYFVNMIIIHLKDKYVTISVLLLTRTLN